MDPFADIDLDAAAVWLDGAWYTRDALARRIKEQIEAGDFRVSRPSQALERLEAALAASRVMAVRMPSALAAAVEATAARLERPSGHLIREAIAYYLAAAEAYVAQAEAAAAGAPPEPEAGGGDAAPGQGSAEAVQQEPGAAGPEDGGERSA
ncbi:MAG TPA: ribbon-helix-helix protein, CopG family [Anaeromyxobacter sp.]